MKEYCERRVSENMPRKTYTNQPRKDEWNYNKPTSSKAVD